MGLITGLLTLPLAPVRGVAWIGEQVAEQAAQELDVEARIRRELGRLEMEHELGNLTTAEFEEQEDALLEELLQLHAEPLGDEEADSHGG
jgi:hypothetical protein